MPDHSDPSRRSPSPCGHHVAVIGGGPAGLMAAETLAGAGLAKRLPVRVVRAIVIVTGLVMSALFFARSG